MMTLTKGSTAISRVEAAVVDVDFDTILESAAMVYFEAHHYSGWGMAFTVKLSLT